MISFSALGPRYIKQMPEKCRKVFVSWQCLVKINDSTEKKPKILFWWQKTQTSLSFPFSSCYNNFNTPALLPMASCSPSSTRQNSYHWLLEHFFKEMQSEKSSAPETYSINNSYNCGGHYPPSGSFIHFLVAGASSGFSDSNLPCDFGKTPVKGGVLLRYTTCVPKTPFSLLLLVLWLSPGLSDCLWAVGEQRRAADQLPLSRALLLSIYWLTISN